MCRLLGWVARTPVSLREVLGERSLAAFAELSRLHPHGWGFAWSGPDGSPTVKKSAACAADDPSFLETATEVKTGAAVAHLRWATAGLSIELRNTHPFQVGSSAFAHNGAIHPVDRVQEALDPAWRARLSGTTDSESYFLAVLAQLSADAPDVPTAVSRVVTRLSADFDPGSLNAMLLRPEALYVVNCHDPARAPAANPHAVRSATAIETDAPYFDLRYRVSPDAVVVASSGFAQPEGEGWRPLDNGSMLVIDRRTLAAERVPLDAAQAAAQPAGPR